MKNKKQIEERIELISDIGKYGAGIKKGINKREVYDNFLLKLLKPSDENEDKISSYLCKDTNYKTISLKYDDFTFYQTMIILSLLESILKIQGKERKFSIKIDKDNKCFIIIAEETSLDILYLIIDKIKFLKDQYISYFYDKYDQNISEIKDPNLSLKLLVCEDLNEIRNELYENLVMVNSQYNNIIGAKLTNLLINKVRDIVYDYDDKEKLNNLVLQLTDVYNIIEKEYLNKEPKIQKEKLNLILLKPRFLDILFGYNMIYLIEYNTFIKNEYTDLINQDEARHHYMINVINLTELFDQLSVNYILSSMWDELNK